MEKPRHNIFENKPSDKEEVVHRTNVVEDIMVMLVEGRAKIISKHEIPSVTGRRTFKLTVELEE